MLASYTNTVYVDGVEGIVNTVDIPTRATGSKASRTAEAFVRSLIQSSNAEAYKTLAQAIASASVPEYEKITCPLLCVAGQEDQVARLEDLALIGDRYVAFPGVCNSQCSFSALRSHIQPADSYVVAGEHRPRRSSRFCLAWDIGTALRMQKAWKLA